LIKQSELEVNKERYTDEELVAKYISSNDLHYFTDLFMRYDHLILGVCLKYLENMEDAKDAVMNIFEKVQKEIYKHEVNNFRGWIYVVSRNHCLMKLRTENKNVEIPFEDFVIGNMESEQIWHPLFEDESSDNVQSLVNCMEELSKDQLECIRGFYFEKLSYQELAQKFGFSLKKIKSHIQNGKRNLKNCIEKGEE